MRFSTVELAHPLLPVDMFLRSIQTTDNVEIVVGKEDEDEATFIVPYVQIKSIPDLKKLCDEGAREGKPGRTIILRDESPAAFRLFLRWLIQGLDIHDTAMQDAISVAELLALADKWVYCSHDREQLVKHLSNTLEKYLSENPWTELPAVISCYNFLRTSPARFVVIHAIVCAQYQEGLKTAWLVDKLGDDARCDLRKFETILPDPQYDLEDRLTAQCSSRYDRSLLPLLFAEIEQWPAWLGKDYASLKPDVKPPLAVQNFLELDLEGRLRRRNLSNAR